jgi:hypothetical protein
VPFNICFVLLIFESNVGQAHIGMDVLSLVAFKGKLVLHFNVHNLVSSPILFA